MPSILVELGFLSNIMEEQFLIKSSTQELMAISMYNAFVEYKNQLEGTKRELMPVPKIEQPETPVPTPKDTVSTSDITTTPLVKLPDTEKTADLQTPVATNEQTSTTVSTSDSENKIRFRVQFLATPENINLNDKNFTKLPQVKKYKEGNLWKYTAGDALTFEDAQEIQKTVRTYYPDSFIVAFRNEQKISVREAREEQ